MAEVVTPPNEYLIRKVADLERRMLIRERMPSGLESIGTQHLAPVPAGGWYRAAALNHTTSGASEAISWDTGVFETTDTLDGGAATRITATATGLYLVTARVGFASNATGTRIAFIQANGATEVDRATVPAAGGGNITSINLVVVVPLVIGDYLEVVGFQNSGGALAYTVGRRDMHFDCVWVGQST